MMKKWLVFIVIILFSAGLAEARPVKSQKVQADKKTAQTAKKKAPPGSQSKKRIPLRLLSSWRPRQEKFLKRKTNT